MYYDLVLIASIYPRSAWEDGSIDDEAPAVERKWSFPLDDIDSDADVALGLKSLTVRLNGWIKVNRPRLWSSVLVTVYSMEVRDVPA